VRDDERGSWIPSKIINGDVGRRGEDSSVRAAAVHRDRVTGLERLFLSIGTLGIYTGRYDPSLPGRIAWEPAPEPGTTTGTRILSIVEANDSLFFSEGSRIFRRIDGRDARGRWRVAEVNGKYQPGQPELVSVYDITLSPFGELGRQRFYFGGYDANFFRRSTRRGSTAPISQTSCWK